MNRQTIISIITFLLILLWIYASVSKILVYDPNRLLMLKQVVPGQTPELLIGLMIAAELIAAFLLMTNTTRTIGIVLSVILMGIFTIYIGLVVSGIFRYTPCSCGGIIGELSWTQHLVFNIFFLGLALYAYVLIIKEKPMGKETM